MKRTMAATLLALATCGMAQAGDFYVAGDITKTRYSGEGSGSDQGFSLSGGYQFNTNWAAELGYRFIGSNTVNYVEGANKASASYRYRSIQLSGLGMLPLTDQFSVFARLGYGTIKVQESISLTSGSFSDSWRGKGYSSGLLVGLGVDYAFTKQLAVRAEYQRPASDVSLLALGLKYGF